MERVGSELTIREMATGHGVMGKNGIMIVYILQVDHFGPVAYMDASEQVWWKEARNVTYSFLCASPVTGLTELTSTPSPITINPTNYPEPLNCLPCISESFTVDLRVREEIAE
ncbi:unnamed protein product, partial [Mesorhabditis belari]|uniref:Uncharacterized protein n=1 Tax=Mesorhabditis belari TaxID=2138241 RepID=A0AAF3EXT7_9BILA